MSSKDDALPKGFIEGNRVQYERLRMAGRLKGTKESAREMLEILKDVLSYSKGKKFYLKFLLKEVDE